MRHIGVSLGPIPRPRHVFVTPPFGKSLSSKAPAPAGVTQERPQQREHQLERNQLARLGSRALRSGGKHVPTLADHQGMGQPQSQRQCARPVVGSAAHERGHRCKIAGHRGPAAAASLAFPLCALHLSFRASLLGIRFEALRRVESCSNGPRPRIQATVARPRPPSPGGCGRRPPQRSGDAGASALDSLSKVAATGGRRHHLVIALAPWMGACGFQRGSWSCVCVVRFLSTGAFIPRFRAAALPVEGRSPMR